MVRITKEYYNKNIEEFLNKVDKVKKTYGNITLIIHGTYTPLYGGIINPSSIIANFGDPVATLRYGKPSMIYDLKLKKLILKDDAIFYKFENNKVIQENLTHNEAQYIIATFKDKIEEIINAYKKIEDLFELHDFTLYFLVYKSPLKLSIFNLIEPKKINSRTEKHSKKLEISYKEVVSNYTNVIRMIIEKSPEEVIITGGCIGSTSHIFIIARELGIKVHCK